MTPQPPATPTTPISIGATLTYLNPPSQQQMLSIMNKKFAIKGKHFIAGTMAVPTTAGGTPIPLTGLSSLGWALIVNNDPTNLVDVLVAVGGTIFAQMLPGEPLLMRFGAGVTAPAVVANGAPVDIEYLILEA
jgi:hypothetical protein